MGAVTLLARPHILSDRDQQKLELPFGETIDGILTVLHWREDVLPYTRVFVDGQLVPREYWARLRPKEGRSVVIALVPGGGGKKNPLALVAALAVAIVAPYAGAAIAGAIGAGGVFSVAATTAAMGSPLAVALGAGLGVVGMLGVNAMFRPPAISQAPTVASPADSAIFSFTGQSNVATPYQPCISVYGTHKVFPRVVGNPYIVNEGDASFMLVLYDFGYGPVNLYDIRIGDTPIWNYSGVLIQVHQMYKAGDPLAFYTNDISTASLGYELIYTTQTFANSQPNSTAIVISLVCPEGLFALDDRFGKLAVATQLEIVYRNVTTGGPWKPFTDAPYFYVSSARAVVLAEAGNFQGAPVTLSNDIEGFPTQYGFPAGLGSMVVASGPIPAVGNRFDMFGQRTINAVVGNMIHFTPLLESNWVTEIPRKYWVPYPPIPWIGTWHVYPPTPVSFRMIPSTGLLQLGASTTEPFFTDLSLYFSEFGEYQVRITRVSDPAHPPNFPPGYVLSTDKIFDAVNWIAIKSLNPYAPIAPKSPRTIMELRIRASDQLNGVIDTLNAIAKRMLPVVDLTGVPSGGTPTGWFYAETSNPEWMVLDVLRGPINPHPVADQLIDWPKFGELGYRNNLTPPNVPAPYPAWQVDTVVDYSTSVGALVSSLCSACWAAPTMRDGRYSIIMDEENLISTQLFTPLNSSGFRVNKTLLEMPHAIRAKYIDTTMNWEARDITVYNDGYSEANATRFESVTLFGCLRPDMAWRWTRRLLGQAKLRQEEIEIDVDIENLHSIRGDLVSVQSDVLKVGGASSRIVGVLDAYTIKLRDPIGAIGPGDYGLRLRLQNGFVAGVVPCVQHPSYDDTWVASVPLDGVAIGDLCTWGYRDRVTGEYLVKHITPGSDLSAKLTLVEQGLGIFISDQGPIPPYIPQGGGVPTEGEGLLPRNLIYALIEYIDDDHIPVYDIRLEWSGSAFAVKYRTYEIDQLTNNRIPISEEAAHSAIVATGVDRTVIPIEGLTLIYEVTAVSRRGTESNAARVAVKLYQDLALPADVASFNYYSFGESLLLTWAASKDPRVFGYQIRFSPVTDAPVAWNQAAMVEKAIPFDVISHNDKGRIGTYLIKAYTAPGPDGGHFSANATSVVVTKLDSSGNIIISLDYFTYPGTLTNCFVSGVDLIAVDDDVFWLGVGSDSFWLSRGTGSDPFWAPSSYATMTWVTSVTVDPDNYGAALSLDATFVNTAEIEFSTDAISWFPMGAAITPTQPLYYFRVTVQGGPVRGRIQNAHFNFDVPDLVETLSGVTVAASGTRLPITLAYRAILAVLLTVDKVGVNTAISAGVKDYNHTLGPMVECYDAAGAAVIGKVNARIGGY